MQHVSLHSCASAQVAQMWLAWWDSAPVELPLVSQQYEFLNNDQMHALPGLYSLVKEFLDSADSLTFEGDFEDPVCISAIPDSYRLNI